MFLGQFKDADLKWVLVLHIEWKAKKERRKEKRIDNDEYRKMEKERKENRKGLTQ